MATPTVAGNAVLLQQYFTEGFYPSGVKTKADGFAPSGALLKALLMHSGQAVSMVTDDLGNQVCVLCICLSLSALLV